MSLKKAVSNIKSVGDVAGAEYERPDPEKVKKFQDNLKKEENKEAYQYLRKRGLTDKTIAKFSLGYDPKRDAISIPVKKRGETINIKYRLLNPGNYKYSQEKGCEVWIFNEEGIEIAKDQGRLLIVEGEFDAMMCWQNGIVNVVSPASGKDSYGPWLEAIDDVEEVYIAYDNDEPGREAAEALASRIGEGKCLQIIYPAEIKDANDYFLEYSRADFNELKNEAEPFFTYQFQTLGDVINAFRDSPEKGLELNGMPGVELRDDHMIIVSGKTNAGKTTFVLNLASQLMEKDIPTLVLPFERGIKDVGPSFLSIDMGATEGEMRSMPDKDWDSYLTKVRDMPLYFSHPSKEEVKDTIRRARRIFNTRVVIIDHLDYLSQQADDKYKFQAEFMHDMKEFAIEQEVAFIIVHHPNKPQQFNRNKRLTNDDLGGSSSISQVAETVIFVEAEWNEGIITTYCTKNKGPMLEKTFAINKDTGRIGEAVTNPDEFDSITSEDESW